MKKLMIFLSIAAIFSSCAAPFQKGGFIVPAICLVGFLVFGIQYYVGWKKAKPEFYNLVLAILCFVASLGAYLWMISDK